MGADDSKQTADGNPEAGKGKGDQDEQQNTEAATGKGGAASARSFTQEQVDQIVAERLRREREKAEAMAKAERERAEAEAAARNKLAEQRQARIDELERVAMAQGETQATLEKYRMALEGALKAQKGALPRAVAALLDRMDPVEQMAWIGEHAASLQTGGKKGIEQSPDPAQHEGTSEAELQKRRADFSRQVNSMF